MDIPIGQLSRRTQVKVPTIRYYEQIGLLVEPTRTEGQQRRYGLAEVDRLNFIRHARELGFEIEDIRELLVLSVKPERACAEADEIAQRHLLSIEKRLRRLNALRAELERMVKNCKRGRIGECRIIHVLADHAQCSGEHPKTEPTLPKRRSRS